LRHEKKIAQCGILLEKAFHVINKLATFYRTRRFIVLTHKPATYAYPEPNETIPRSPIVFGYDTF
jgi:hypothetical protein